MKKNDASDGFEEIAPGLRSVSIRMSKTAFAKLELIQKDLSKTMPNASLIDAIDQVLTEFLKVHDPLQRHARRSLAEQVGLPTGPLTAGQRDAAIFRANGICEHPGCVSRAGIRADHIVPRSEGGTNVPENLRALCPKHSPVRAKKQWSKR